MVTIRRRATQREQNAARLAAALNGVPIWTDDDDLPQMVEYAQLLAPKKLHDDTDKAAGRDRFLREALIISAHGVDLSANITDGTTAVHTREVSFGDGSFVRVADVEAISEHAASRAASRAVVKNRGTLRR